MWHSQGNANRGHGMRERSPSPWNHNKQALQLHSSLRKATHMTRESADGVQQCLWLYKIPTCDLLEECVPMECWFAVMV